MNGLIRVWRLWDLFIHIWAKFCVSFVWFVESSHDDYVKPTVAVRKKGLFESIQRSMKAVSTQKKQKKMRISQQTHHSHWPDLQPDQSPHLRLDKKSSAKQHKNRICFLTDTEKTRNKKRKTAFRKQASVARWYLTESHSLDKRFLFLAHWKHRHRRSDNKKLAVVDVYAMLSIRHNCQPCEAISISNQWNFDESHSNPMTIASKAIPPLAQRKHRFIQQIIWLEPPLRRHGKENAFRIATAIETSASQRRLLFCSNLRSFAFASSKQ